jgi:hypothetical protein
MNARIVICFSKCPRFRASFFSFSLRETAMSAANEKLCGFAALREKK